jgi:hypothetical protein
MTTERNPARGQRLAIFVAAAVGVLLAGCSTGERLRDLGYDAEARYLHTPVASAVHDLGPPQRSRPLADLREYTWTTGVQGAPGGDCTLRLIADKRGVVVDYRMDGTPLGCSRLLAKT